MDIHHVTGIHFTPQIKDNGLHSDLSYNHVNAESVEQLWISHAFFYLSSLELLWIYTSVIAIKICPITSDLPKEDPQSSPSRFRTSPSGIASQHTRQGYAE
ncbi:hypothetical protein KIL84_003632 [Mauremys mutica]|uniref:Uncharacterized protein n=1 Tax=Mauremys mutica TaxID=74926 RepID=A0A9D4ARP0_9SAUR|nr:hypothetical protein KIL84_003632 [Mauremys mutica]